MSLRVGGKGILNPQPEFMDLALLSNLIQIMDRDFRAKLLLLPRPIFEANSNRKISTDTKNLATVSHISKTYLTILHLQG